MRHSLVLALTLTFAAPTLAREDALAPLHDDGIERLGVLPFRVQGKARKKNRADAQLYFKLFVEHLEAHRGQAFSLANPRERTLRASRRKTLLRAVRKRAAAAKVTRVIAGTLRGRGGQQYLDLELFDLTGHTLSKYRVKPRNRPAREWGDEVMAAFVLRPPAPKPAPEPASKSTTAPAVESSAAAEDSTAIAVEPRATEQVEPAQGGAAGLWWTVGAVSFGVLGAAALTGGGFMAAEAWGQSEELIKLQPGDPQRVALEDSSIQKALLADTLFVTGAVLVAASVGAGLAAAFADGGE